MWHAPRYSKRAADDSQASAHDQHRAWRVADDAVGHGAEQHALDVARGAGSHDDETCVHLLRMGADGLGRLFPCDHLLDLHALGRLGDERIDLLDELGAETIEGLVGQNEPERREIGDSQGRGMDDVEARFKDSFGMSLR